MKGHCCAPSHLLLFSSFPLKETFPEAPRDPPDFHSLCQPSVSLDNFYLSLDKNIVTQSSFEDPDTELVWNQQEVRADSHP